MMLFIAYLLTLRAVIVWFLCVTEIAHGRMYRASNRRHMRRQGFAAWVDYDGKINIEVGDDRPHAERCAASLRDCNDIDRYLRWKPWRAVLYAVLAWMIVLW